MKINNIIETIIQATESKGVDPKKTNDQIIIGDPFQDATGIVTTFMATVEVINETIEKGYNLIITHEPTWFNGKDQEDWLKEDKVYQDKRELLETNNIVIWRFHDYMHQASKDLIYRGFNELLGWQKYAVEGIPDSYNPLEKADLTYHIPAITVSDLLELLKEKLNMPVIRYIGSLDSSVSRAGLLLGGSGLGLGDEVNPMKLIHNSNLDTIICGDIVEWTIPAYIRDAVMMKKNLSMIIIGHNRSEEEGMKYIVPWIENLLPSVPVMFIESGEPFNYYF